MLFTGIGIGVASYVRVLLQGCCIEINWSKPLIHALYAGFIVLGKFPEAQGVLHYYLNKALGKTSKIIEYKAIERK